jgi:hypothetical protein
MGGEIEIYGLQLLNPTATKCTCGCGRRAGECATLNSKNCRSLNKQFTSCILLPRRCRAFVKCVSHAWGAQGERHSDNIISRKKRKHSQLPHTVSSSDLHLAHSTFFIPTYSPSQRMEIKFCTNSIVTLRPAAGTRRSDLNETAICISN